MTPRSASVVRNLVRRSLAAAAIVLLAACADDADPTGTTDTGSIRGTVTDDIGAPVANAGIELTGNDQDARTTTTATDGEYTFADVPPGTYTLAVTPPTGFAIGAAGTTTVTVSGQAQANAAALVLDRVPAVDSCALVRPEFGVATAAELELFSYDVNAPLNLATTVEDTVGGVEVSAISYDSPDGGRVTGLLFDPVGRPGPLPAIVLMYGGNGDVTGMRATADLLARHGAVVITIDAPFARRAGQPLDFTARDSAEQVQHMKDLQRAVDVLLAHPRVDAERIAFQGNGFGGTAGVLFAGIERRIQGAALVVPDAGWVSQMTGPGKTFFGSMSCAVRVAWLRSMTPIEPIRFIAHSTPTPLLFQNGLQDGHVPKADAEALHAAAAEPKTVRWYPSRQLGEPGLLDRIAWLHERIGIDAELPAGEACSFERPHFGVASAAERSLFAYDVDAPLNLVKTLQATTNGVERSAISYDSPDGGQATGFMFDPVARPAGRPAIVLMHGMPGSAADMIGYATTLASYGAVVIAIDAPHARRGPPPILMTPEDRDEQIRLMRDLQRAVDVLRADPRVDDDRIAYLGVSYGGAMGALFAGIEQRIATAVLVVGDGGLITHSTRPEDFDYLSTLTCGQRAAWFEAMSPIEPIRFIPLAAGTPLLLQNGHLDDLVRPADAAALHEAAPEPKTVLWYNAGHNLNQQAAFDRHNWLSLHIGLDPL